MKPDGYHLLLGGAALRGRRPAPRARDGNGAPLVEQGAPGIVLTAGKRCGLVVLPGDTGFILGTLFDRSGRRLRSVTPETAAAWVTMRGRTLIERHWGAWLAVLRTAEGMLLIRDPSGMFPCYYRVADDGVSVASDLAWADCKGPMPRGISWDEVHAQLHYSSFRSARTAIEGLHELLPGASLLVAEGSTRGGQLWTPYGFASGWGGLPGFGECAERLRRTTDLTVASWARQFDRPLIDLSGGLDSSIVAAACANAAPALEAVSYRGGDADLDETGYARAVADHLGIPLHRERLDLGLVDLRRSAAGDLPRPSGRSFSQANDVQDIALATRLGCDAFFAGAGGDSIFWYFNSAAPALDRLKVEGPAGFLRTTSDLATMCGVSRRRALAIALRKWAQRRPRPWPNSVALLAREAREKASQGAHPWWPPPPGTLPGVRAYVLALIQLGDHHEYHLRSRHAPLIAPLASQPIVETCLGIPSWLSCSGGANRAVARAAFADRLPPSILARRTKGGFDGFVHELLERNRPVARAMLLDGTLAGRGWLDCATIERLLADPAPVAPQISLRLLRLIAVEAWLAAVGGR
ncbi:MAG TPA: asparagine synthase-related protein [Sphingomonas sp.]|nr:asparagine synthase-related protein [Sphingomonas sp.]